MVKIIRGARIFDGTGAEPISDGIVAIEHGKIIHVGQAASFTEPKQDTQVIDVGGRTVLPGLIDLHVQRMMTATVIIRSLHIFGAPMTRKRS